MTSACSTRFWRRFRRRVSSSFSVLGLHSAGGWSVPHAINRAAFALTDTRGPGGYAVVCRSGLTSGRTEGEPSFLPPSLLTRRARRRPFSRLRSVHSIGANPGQRAGTPLPRATSTPEAKGGHADVDGDGWVGAPVDLGELVAGAGETDLESFGSRHREISSPSSRCQSLYRRRPGAGSVAHDECRPLACTPSGPRLRPRPHGPANAR